MLRPTRLRLRQLQAMRPWLRRAYGRRWPLAFVRGLLAARRLVRRTRWAGRRDPEAAFVGALALLPAVVAELRRQGDGSDQAARELAQAVLADQHERSARAAGLAEIADARERWHAYMDRAVPQGFHAFDESDCLALEPDRVHVRVFRCALAELAAAAGVQDLLRTACASGDSFHQRLLPDHDFRRSGPVRGAISCGESFCDYVWERPHTASAGDAVMSRGGRSKAASDPASAEREAGSSGPC